MHACNVSCSDQAGTSDSADLASLLGISSSLAVCDEKTESDLDFNTISTAQAVKRVNASLVGTPFAWILPVCVDQSHAFSDSETNCGRKVEFKCAPHEQRVDTSSDSSDSIWDRYPPAQTRMLWEKVSTQV